MAPAPSDTSVIGAAPCGAPCAPASARWVLTAAMLASSLVFIDGTVVNVALPALQRSLDAGLADVPWVVASYALFFAALLLVGGAAGDRFGRRRVFACGFALLAFPGVDAGYWRGFFLGIAVLGLGLASSVAPLTTPMMNSV